MKLKNYLKFCLKVICSGILALAILSLFCLVYYNPPISVAQPNGYTNSKFLSNTYWSYMIEGYGYGVINELGYNDLQNPVAGRKTICFLGSSHTEALQVGAEKNFVALLESMLSTDENASNDYQCLNLGVSGHFFNVVVSNFENFAKEFKNIDYVIIEANNVEFTEKEIEKMLNGDYHSDLGERSWAYKSLQRIPYLRLLVKQYQDLQKNSNPSIDATNEESTFDNYKASLDPVMKKLSAISKENGFEIIILKHSEIAFDDNNKAYAKNNAEALVQFKESCEANGIRFLSVDDVFCEYADTYAVLPRGFSNSRPGKGHLNEVGHRLIAEHLYTELFAAKEA